MQIQHLKTYNEKVVNNRKRGFTLIEILVVLAIIGILLSVGVSAIKGLSTSKGVSTAVPLAESVFEQARLQARNGTLTRVVIYADTNGTIDEHRNRYLRMMGVATGRLADGTNAKKGDTVQDWKLVSRPILIPSGAYFNNSLSTHSTGLHSADFPGGTKSCYVYEFNSEGALITASDNGGGNTVTGGQFVVQAGKLGPQATTPTVDANAKRDVGGFKVFKSGRLARFKDPNQIVGAGDPEF